MEGTDGYAVITVLRDVTIYNGPLTIAYATSDLSAKGVDADKFTACLGVATNLRAPEGCGDYQQTSGTFSLPQGANSGGFQVNIMNNLCKERYFRYLQV